MDIKVVKTDGSHYPYKSKKKRIYKKWLKKHIVSSCVFSNVTPNKVTMNEGKDGVTIDVTFHVDYPFFEYYPYAFP